MATKKTTTAADENAILAEETAVILPAEENATPSDETQSDGDSAGFCVYIGPTILGVIQSGTVYTGNVKNALASIAPAVERYPEIAHLVVSGDTLPVDRIKVKRPGNLLYVYYHQLISGKKK